MSLHFGSSVFPFRPECPECGMNMIVVEGFGLDRESQIFQCLRCGYVDAPADTKKSSRRTA
jgi:predicted RNA-binding Zn-ribbon protein involved in translation (DUF1610 family)